MVIDADAHANEPRDLFDRYLEKDFRDNSPKVVESTKSFTGWWKANFFLVSSGNYGHGTPNGYLFQRGKPDMAISAPGLDDVEGRLKDMDQEGIDIQVVYPNIMAMASHLDDGDLAAAMCRAYNNYSAEKCLAFDGRVRAVSAVPLQKPAEAAKELRRAIKDLGLVGTVITGLVGQRNLDDPYFDEFFREANDLGATVGVHWITGCFDSPGQERFKDPYFYIHMVGMPFNLRSHHDVDRRRHHGEVPADQIRFSRDRRRLAALLDVAHGRSLLQIDASPRRRPQKPSDYVRATAVLSPVSPTKRDSTTPRRCWARTRIVFASDYPHGEFPTFRIRWSSFASAPTSRMKSRTKYFRKTRRGSTGSRCELLCAWL